MPEETFETSQPTEPKSFDWPKIVLAGVLGLGLLVGAAYAGYHYGTQQVPPANEPTPVVSQPTPTPEATPSPTPTPPHESGRCIQSVSNWDDYYGRRDSGDYYVEIPFTREVSEDYIKTSGVIYVEAEARTEFTVMRGETKESLAREFVKVSLELIDHRVSPYTQKVVITAQEDEVVEKLGRSAFDEADGIGFIVHHGPFKTADGVFCSEEQVWRTELIR